MALRIADIVLRNLFRECQDSLYQWKLVLFQSCLAQIPTIVYAITTIVFD